MILRDALDTRRGTAQRNKIYKGTYKVWDRNKIALEGYCKQKTTEGRNLLDISLENTTLNGVDIAYDEKTGILTLNGTATSSGTLSVRNTDFLTLLGGFSYTISLRVVSGSYTHNTQEVESSSIQIWKKWNKNFQAFFSNIVNNFFTQTRNLTEDVIYDALQIKVAVGDVFNDFKIQVQLEKGATYSEFEPYTGGQPSPNPDYPQEIEVMQGRQVVNIKNNNYCFTKASDWKIGQYNMEGAIDDTSTIGLKRIRLNGLIPVPQDTQLYFDTFLNPYQLIIRGYDNNKNFVGSYGAVPNKTILNTSGRGIKYLGVSIFNSSGEETTGQTILDKIQSGEIKPFICLNSEEDKSFKPYKNEQYTVDLKSKNLFDVNDVRTQSGHTSLDSEDYVTIEYDNSNGSAKIYQNYFTNVNKELKTGTKYYLIFQVKAVSGDGSFYATSVYQKDSQVSANTIYRFKDLTANQTIVREITTINNFDNCKDMLRTYCSFEVGEKGSITFRLSVLEEQPTVENFNYEPYYDYKLAGIGDYKDNFYTDKGKWYFKQNIGKYLVNNDLESNGEQTNRISLLTPILNVIPNNSTAQYKSNLMLGDITNDTGMNGTTGSKKIRVVLSKEYASNHSEASTFLTNKKMQIYFPFEIPTVTEVPSTYTTLINKLNALYQEM